MTWHDDDEEEDDVDDDVDYDDVSLPYGDFDSNIKILLMVK